MGYWKDNWNKLGRDLSAVARGEKPGASEIEPGASEVAHKEPEWAPQFRKAPFKSTSHFLHFCLTAITGIWILVWIVCTLSNSQKNRRNGW